VSESDHLLPEKRDSLPGRREGGDVRRRDSQEATDVFRPVGSINIDNTSRPEEVFPAWDEIRRIIRENLSGLGEGAARLAEDDRAFRDWVSDIVTLHRESWAILPKDEGRLVDFLREQLFGYRGLERYLDMPDLEEIFFTRWDIGFFVLSGETGQSIPEQIFPSEQDFFDFIGLIANENHLTINNAEPVLDAVLKRGTGARVAAVIPPIAPDGLLTIRKQRESPYDLSTYLETGIITAEAADDLRRMTQGGYHLLVSGGTASGKTSLLNVIGGEWIPKTERLLILEDTPELKIKTNNTGYLVTRQAAIGTRSKGADVVMRDLIKICLRQRPDRIIIGEVRDKAAYDALSAFNTGHDGSMLTIHANSASNALNRLQQYALAADEMKEDALNQLIGNVAPIVIQLLKFKDGRRRITEITQVFHPDDLIESVGEEEAAEMFKRGEIHWKWEKAAFLRPLYRYSHKDDKLHKIVDPVPIQHHDLAD
jgi:pilus assembly protein CpaF